MFKNTKRSLTFSKRIGCLFYVFVKNNLMFALLIKTYFLNTVLVILFVEFSKTMQIRLNSQYFSKTAHVYTYTFSKLHGNVCYQFAS